jgi:MFS family permease
MHPAPLHDISLVIPSHYPWMRLAVALLLSTIGGVGMWSVVVALPSVQTEFGVARGAASLPYTTTMICFGIASIFIGRLADRIGIFIPLVIGAILLSIGYLSASHAATIGQFTLLQGLLIGVGSSVTFAPLLADTSLWFTKNRGLAVGIIASGNYLAGTIWPPLLTHFIQTSGWRETYAGVAWFCLLTMLPLALVLRRRAPTASAAAEISAQETTTQHPLGLAPNALQVILIVAGLSCCVAMSMPQVHIIAYCGDLGFGPARGAQMLALMLACGIVSRLSFGWISDRIGGLRTLLLGSSLQAFALLLFVPFDGLVSLYLISALFGLFQGGIVPAYAIIVREFFPSKEAGTRISMVLTATMFGMALGGWMSGVIFDWFGSYRAAFINGVAWNLLNVAIALWLLRRYRAAKLNLGNRSP